ncbi:MAG: redoxin domain-containing protein [Myxococcales bacterium]|nr:redoxin domain-containing protein [Myxococcales bacterium]
MKLKVGDQAPDFSIETLDGSTVSLSDMRGKLVWLAFFRYAACPLCNFRVHQLLSVWPKTFSERSFVMLGVFQSPGRKLEGLVKRHDPPFKIVSDPKMELYVKYYLEASMRGVMGKDVRQALAGASKAGIPLVRPWDGTPHRIPADFLVDRHGMIKNAFYGENIAQHIPFEEVTDFLDAHGA